MKILGQEFRVCKKCNKKIEISHFPKVSGSTHHRGSCKVCYARYRGEYYIKNKPQILKDMAQDYKDRKINGNIKRVPDNRKGRVGYLNRKKRYSRGVRGKWNNYKGTAKYRNIEFDLTFEQFEQFWGKDCAYCGDKMGTIGLDRIDPKLGYTLSNISPCCFQCNIMKASCSVDDFLNHCKKIIKHLEMVGT